MCLARNEKTFKYYNQLLPEVRIMVLDNMRPDDRCRFTRCSKLSFTEAKSSKNFIHGLRFYAYLSCITIDVEIDNFGNGFKLKFEKQFGRNCMIYENTMDRQFSTTWLENSIDLVYFGTQHYKKLLKSFQNTVKALYFSGEYPKYFNFLGVTSLRNLKKLEVYGNFDISQIFSRLRGPLKELSVDATEYKWPQRITDFEEIYRVQNRLTLYDVELSYEQFLQLSAKNVNIPLGPLTAQEILKFIKSWKNSPHKKYGSYRWRLGRTRFEERWLIRRLNVEEGDMSARDNIKIRHNYDDDKVAKLLFNNYEVGFEELGQDDDDED